MADRMNVDEWADAIRSERERQFEKGYDLAHDTQAGTKHILNLAVYFAWKGEQVKCAAMIDAVQDVIRYSSIKTRLKFLFTGKL